MERSNGRSVGENLCFFAMERPSGRLSVHYNCLSRSTRTSTEHTDTAMLERDVTDKVIGGFFRVYKNLGFGFLEARYVNALGIGLQRLGVSYAREVMTEVSYLGVPIGQYRIDMVVEGRVLVEVTATKALTEADSRQVLNYLKATNLEVGLLLHFGPSPKFERFLYTNDRKHQ